LRAAGQKSEPWGGRGWKLFFDLIFSLLRFFCIKTKEMKGAL